MHGLMYYITTPWFVALSLSLLVIITVLLLTVYWRKTSDARCLKKLIKKYSQACEQDVAIDDGLDGLLFADYLLLIQGKIIVLKVLNKRGYVFGGEKIDEWTCMGGKKTEKFNNPLVSVNLFAQVLKYSLDFVEVEACILFGNQSVFAKGVPQGVVTLDNLEEKFTQMKSSKIACEQANQAWQKALILTSAGKTDAMVEQRAA